MAQDEAKFSHITVTSDDEDEFVIQAGARPSAPSAPAPDAPEEPQAPEAEPEPAQAPEAEREDGFRETTAEDLELAPMPFMQKAVIAVAVLLVIAVVAYIVTR